MSTLNPRAVFCQPPLKQHFFSPLSIIIAALSISQWCTQSHATGAAATFDIFSQPFEQPTILQAFRQENSSLDEIHAVVPASAPAHYQGKELSSSSHITFEKIHTFRSDMEFESMMQQKMAKDHVSEGPGGPAGHHCRRLG
jgi:hypothetical protein